MQSRTYIKLVQIARMRVAGHKDDIIASHLGLSRSGISQITARPEYKEVENSVLEGRISKLDELLAGQVEKQQKLMEVAVPMALRALVESVSQRRDLRACLDASKEILDRDPKRTFAKQSRTVAEPQAREFLNANELRNLVIDADNVAKEVRSRIAAVPKDAN